MKASTEPRALAVDALDRVDALLDRIEEAITPATAAVLAQYNTTHPEISSERPDRP